MRTTKFQAGNEEERVKWKSKKRYKCKKNKGEHYCSDPVIKYKPGIRYIYKTNEGILESERLHPEYKFMKAIISLATETRCKHCNKKFFTFFSEKIF